MTNQGTESTVVHQGELEVVEDATAGPSRSNFDHLVAQRCTRPGHECILLKREGGTNPPLPASHRVVVYGDELGCRNWISKNCRTSLSHRQYLSYLQRDTAARTQIVRDPAGGIRSYDVPSGKTPDELKLPRFAGSFHKLLEHSVTTGLLTQTSVGCGVNGGVINYERLLDGLMIDAPSSNFDTTDLNALELCHRNPGTGLRPRVLINPRSSKALSIKGPDVASVRVSELLYAAKDEARLLGELSLGSDQTAAEMIEVYAMALLRAPILGAYTGLADADLAVQAINAFGAAFIWGYEPDGTPVTAATRPVETTNLFRGPSEGDRLGDYLSVFLTFLRPPLFPSGCAPFVADLIGAGQFAMLLGEELRVPLGPPLYFGVTWDHFVRIQNAEVPQPYPRGFFTGRTPIRTGIDLGNYVHVDNVYEPFIRAADILVGGQYDRTSASPYTPGPAPVYPSEGDGPTLGPSDAYALLGGVREVAERAAFTQKWLVARRARPEVLAGLVHLANRPVGGLSAADQTLRTDVRAALSPHLVLPDDPSADTATQRLVRLLLKRVRQDNRVRQALLPRPASGSATTEDNYLLSQMYPEGSPAHPAWTSGHATVAGACATVLKALFNDTQCILDPSVMPASRACYQPYPGGPELTVGGELDKLASNISLGRNFGGVHYRSDGEHGILLGEEVAIRYLQDHLREYREQLRPCGGSGRTGFQLSKRNRQRVCITVDAVVPVPSVPAPKGPTIFGKSVL